jgi:hypothetical protein
MGERHSQNKRPNSAITPCFENALTLGFYPTHDIRSNELNKCSIKNVFQKNWLYMNFSVVLSVTLSPYFSKW